MAATATYTAEQTAEVVATYTAAPTAETVAVLAEKLGKTVKSVVAKLAREGIYKKAEKAGTSKAGARKDEIVLALELMVGAELPSFKEATKKDLETLLAFIKREGQ